MSNGDIITIQAGAKPRMRYDAATGQYTISNVSTQTLFGPSQPVEPFAQAPGYGAVGRRFDYQTGYNLNYTPRGDQLVSFPALRALADYDLVRLCIETRKDQMQALDWKFEPKDQKKPDDLADGVTQFFEYPDKVHDYAAWQRALLDDCLVIDAMTVFPRFTNGGTLFALELVDGATVHPLIDAYGRTPLPPNPAYQQIIKGLPSVDYTSQELIYRLHNPRTWKTYGYSAVEQIIVTVNIALRRQQFLLDYYTQGSIPDAFGHLPDTWQPQQIAQFQSYWDGLFANESGQNSAQRRRVRWGPGQSMTFAKEAILKDEMDEWLARIACYAFNLPPTPFIKQMNRAVAQTQQDTAKTEGLLPFKRYWRSFMNYLVQVVMQRPDLQFSWLDDEEVDPLVSAQIEQIEVNSGVKTPDEVRQDKGLEPLAEGRGALPRLPAGTTIAPSEAETKATGEASVAGSHNLAAIGATGATAHAEHAPPGASSTTGAAEPAKGAPVGPRPDEPPVEKLAKAAIHRYVERKPTEIQRHRLTRAMKRTFRAQAQNVVDQFTAHLGKVAKASSTDDPVDDWFDYDAVFSLVPPAVYDPLERASKDSAQYGGTEVGVTIEDGFVNEYSADYAKTRGAEMIGKKWVDGELVDNPDAEWAITGETRDAIRDLLGQAIDNGWTTDELSEELQDSTAFSAARADMVARTEMRLADGGGRQAAWKESGVVTGKVWLIGDDDPCEDCIANADEGEIDLDDVFPSGDDSEPAHPNCNCVVSPVVGGDETDEE